GVSSGRALPATAPAHSLLEEHFRALAPMPSSRLEAFSFLLIVAYEEVLDLLAHRARQIRQLLHIVEELAGSGNSDQPIVFLRLAIFLRLARFDDADQPRRNDCARRNWLIHQHQDVER